LAESTARQLTINKQQKDCAGKLMKKNSATVLGQFIPRLPRFFLTAIALLPATAAVGAPAGPCGVNRSPPVLAASDQPKPDKGTSAPSIKAVPNTADSARLSGAVTASNPNATPASNVPREANTDSRVWLKWTAAPGATDYNIRRSRVRGGPYKLAGSTAATEFVNTGLVNGVQYFFVVTARNVSGESVPSEEISAQPTSSTSTNLTLTMSAGQLQLSWPADHTGWILQMQNRARTAGLGTNWVNVTDSAATNLLLLPVIRTNASVFFRLAHP
jgi:hypothetical protein